jgi:peptidoglycan/LPS O-acetylase OafA/YrhL
MKIVRGVIGSASIIAFFIMFVQSRGTHWSNADPYGVIVGAILFAAGLLGYTKRMSKLTGVIAGTLYVLAAILGFIFMGAHPYLTGWAIASAIVGAFFLIYSIVKQKDLGYGQMPKFNKK